ncbi:MAG: hypothetical protein NTY32_14440, partial [Bacteroidia bacterium]|nr:hypothetical protein [Bacteroidia bacterium]
PLESELTVLNNTPINCAKGQNVTFTKEMLSMVGPDFSPLNLTYPDKNILYQIKELPTDGAVTKGGLPLGIDGRFTQADIDFKNVKYFHNGNSTADSLKIEGRDYAGGTLKDLITVQITIQ